MRRLAVLVPAVLALSGGVAQARLWGWYDVSERTLSCHFDGHDCSAFSPRLAADVWHVTADGRTARRLSSYGHDEITGTRLVRSGSAWVGTDRRRVGGLCPPGGGRDIYVRSRIVVRESFGVLRGEASSVAVARCPHTKKPQVTRSRVAIIGFRIYF